MKRMMKRKKMMMMTRMTRTKLKMRKSKKISQLLNSKLEKLTLKRKILSSEKRLKGTAYS